MVRVYIESSIFKRNKKLTYFGWDSLGHVGWLTHQDLRRTHRNIQWIKLTQNLNDMSTKKSEGTKFSWGDRDQFGLGCSFFADFFREKLLCCVVPSPWYSTPQLEVSCFLEVKLRQIYLYQRVIPKISALLFKTQNFAT
jgi:hypothetical protein